MTQTKCQHANVDEVKGSTRCFMHGVAVHPFTDENRAAHGNICITEACQDCGAERQTLINNRHYEYSPWGPDTATVQARERAEKMAAIEAEKAEDARLLRGTSIVQAAADAVLVSRGGFTKWVGLYDIDSAARQTDDGDGLVPYYSALLRVAQLAIVNAGY
jgi:hypothetical protein